MKTGLVMEGGSMRGMFTCGVIDVMMENGIEFDGAIGVSAGAVFGCNYKSHQIGRALRYNMKYCNDPRYCSFKSLITTGSYFSNEFAYKTLPRELDVYDTDTYKKNKMKFYAVATDAKTGEAVYKDLPNGDEYDVQWLRASAAMPGMSLPVKLDGMELYDGGIADSIPLKAFENMGYDRNVVILTREKGFIKPQMTLLPLARVLLFRYPKCLKVLKTRYIEYNKTTKYIEEKEAKGELFVIRPKEPLNIKAIVHDPGELRRVYNLGREIGLLEVSKIKEYLKK